MMQPTSSGKYLDRAAIALLVGVWGLLFGTAKVNPGGPFISLTGDVAPVVAGAYAIAMCLVALRFPAVFARSVAVLYLLAATALIAFVLLQAVSFGFHPLSRGILISW